MKKTYEISFKEGIEIFRGNEEFREVLSKGQFTFCENRFVINDDKYIERRNDKIVLTEYAKNNESECCLSFNTEAISI